MANERCAHCKGEGSTYLYCCWKQFHADDGRVSSGYCRTRCCACHGSGRNHEPDPMPIPLFPRR